MTTMPRLKQNALRAILAITTLFAVIIAYAALPWPYTQTMDGLAILWLPILPVVVTIIWAAMRRLSSLGNANAHKLVTIMIAAAIAFQIFIAVTINANDPYFIPNDLKHIYDQAVAMISNNTTIFIDTPELRQQFELYPHNANLTILLYWAFRAGHMLGVQNYHLIGKLLNVAAMLSCYLSVYVISRHAHGKTAPCVMAFLLMNPVLYAFVPYYYTDIISIGILAPAAAIAIKYAGTDSRKSVPALISAGVLFAAAVKIRITSLFLLLAAIAYVIIAENPKKYAKAAVAAASGFILMWACMGTLYAYHVPFDTSETRLPPEHWLMMGSCPDSPYTYCYQCVAFTISNPTQAEKKAAALEKYVENMRSHGLTGTIRMIMTKEAQVWSTGDPFLKDEIIRSEGESKIYDALYGVNSAPIRVYLGVYNFILLVMIAISAMLELKKPSANTICAILILGAALFYAFWEANRRYSISFLPYMTLFTMPALQVMAENTPKRLLCKITGKGE